MPFISLGMRSKVDSVIELLEATISTKTDPIDENAILCYCVYKLVKDFKGNEFNNWDTKSDGSKILGEAKDAYHDYVIKPHEGKKIQENGGI